MNAVNLRANLLLADVQMHVHRIGTISSRERERSYRYSIAETWLPSKVGKPWSPASFDVAYISELGISVSSRYYDFVPSNLTDTKNHGILEYSWNIGLILSFV